MYSISYDIEHQLIHNQHQSDITKMADTDKNIGIGALLLCTVNNGVQVVYTYFYTPKSIIQLIQFLPMKSMLQSCRYTFLEVQTSPHPGVYYDPLV